MAPLPQRHRKLKRYFSKALLFPTHWALLFTFMVPLPQRHRKMRRYFFTRRYFPKHWALLCKTLGVTFQNNGRYFSLLWCRCPNGTVNWNVTFPRRYCATHWALLFTFMVPLPQHIGRKMKRRRYFPKRWAFLSKTLGVTFHFVWCRFSNGTVK